MMKKHALAALMLSVGCSKASSDPVVNVGSFAVPIPEAWHNVTNPSKMESGSIALQTLKVGEVKPAPSVMDCGSGHMFSVGIGDKAVAADLAKQVSAAIAKVGPLTAGTTLKPASVKVSVVKGAVRVRTRTNSTPLEVIAPFDDGANTVRATGAKISSVSESPDKTCTAAIGVAMMRAQTQKTETSPRAFGAVVCQAANAQ